MTIVEARSLPVNTYVTDGHHYYRYIADPEDARGLLPRRDMTFYRCNRAGRLHPRRLIVRVFLGEDFGARGDPPMNVDRLSALRPVVPNERGWLPVNR